MKIPEFASESGIIENLKSKIEEYSKNIKPGSKSIKLGIGDDCAILEHSKDEYMLISSDMIVEDVHFSLDYFSPKQIGVKAVESNISDIAAMGGMPGYCLVSLGAPNSSLVEKIYDGINSSASGYNTAIIGGDITKSDKIVISICVIGFVSKGKIALRSNAKVNDLIFCSGSLGESSIGLGLLKKNLSGVCISFHLNPKSRIDLAGKLAKIGVNAMIDLSDGIGSDLRKICEASKAGAIVYAEKVPISRVARQDAKKLGKDPLDFALYGGEDFELLFTASQDKLKELEKLDVALIGEIVDKDKGIKISKEGKFEELRRGFDHFM